MVTVAPTRKSCNLIKQGFHPGSCMVEEKGKRRLACESTLRLRDGIWERLVTSVHLSRPENYLSIYQSGCNLSCRKCHSWYFSKMVTGQWLSPDDICEVSKDYETMVTLREPRERATAWHAHESCRCCGACVLTGEQSSSCPGVLDAEAINYSPQGFGPARNIVAFTGGDLTCRPEFYARCAELIKENTGLWVLLETNGYGLTPEHLDLFEERGVDAFWLDIKAEDPEVHRWLTGCENQLILELPTELLKRNFVFEILSLYIPGRVEEKQLGRIAARLGELDPTIPFTILAFFPEYRLKSLRSPTVEEMVRAYEEARAAGLQNIRLGNLGVFIKTTEDHRFLEANVESCAY